MPLGRATDRRKGTRVKIYWPLTIYGDSVALLQTKTQDISSKGFYFVSEIPFECGESLVARLEIPAHGQAERGQSLAVECLMTVVRVEAVGDAGSFGVGCRITDYRCLMSELDLKTRSI